MENMFSNVGGIPTATDREILNVKQCMELTGFSRGLLYKMTSQRTIPHYKKGKFVLFKRSEVVEWLFDNKVKSKEEEEREIDALLSGRKVGGC